MIRVTIRNPHGLPLTSTVAEILDIEVLPDSSGALAAVYEVDDEEEIEEIRATGLVCERVRTE